MAEESKPESKLESKLESEPESSSAFEKLEFFRDLPRKSDIRFADVLYV